MMVACGKMLHAFVKYGGFGTG